MKIIHICPSCKRNDYETVAPQHFGIASEDINCRCTLHIELVDEVELAPKEIQEAINKYQKGDKQ